MSSVESQTESLPEGLPIILIDPLPAPEQPAAEQPLFIPPDYRARALAALAEQDADSLRRHEEDRLASLEASRKFTRAALADTLGVSAGYTWLDDGRIAYAILDGIPELLFHGEDGRGCVHLFVERTPVIPDGPGYEDWQSNPANFAAVDEWERARAIHEWADVGEAVERALRNPLTIEPWPVQPPAPAYTRYAWLTVVGLNAEPRPFTVLHSVMGDGEAVTLVRYEEVDWS